MLKCVTGFWNGCFVMKLVPLFWRPAACVLNSRTDIILPLATSAQCTASPLVFVISAAIEVCTDYFTIHTSFVLKQLYKFGYYRSHSRDGKAQPKEVINITVDVHCWTHPSSTHIVYTWYET